jgi:hypothetical protein
VTIEGFWIGWLDLLHLIHLHSSGLQAIQRYRYSTLFPVHRYTRTRVLSLHLAVSWQGIYHSSTVTSNITVTTAHAQSSTHTLSLLATVYFLRLSTPWILIYDDSTNLSLLTPILDNSLFDIFHFLLAGHSTGTILTSKWNRSSSQSQSHVVTDSQSVSKSWGLMTRCLLLFDSYGLVFVERPLWREDGSVFCICCWPLSTQFSWARVSWDSRPYFTVSDLRGLFSSLPMTHRVTVEVFDPASTRVSKLSQVKVKVKIILRLTVSHQ